MTLKELYPMISAHHITLFDINVNKVHGIDPKSVNAILPTLKTLETYGEYEVVRLIPLDFQWLQITIKPSVSRQDAPQAH